MAAWCRVLAGVVVVVSVAPQPLPPPFPAPTGEAQAPGHSSATGEAQAPGHSSATGEAQAPGHSSATGEAQAPEHSSATGEAQAPGHSSATGEAQAPGHSSATGEAQAPGHSSATGEAQAPGHSSATGEAQAPGHSSATGEALPSTFPSVMWRRVGRRPSVEVEARQLLAEVVEREMTGCSLMLLFDSHPGLSPLPQPLQQHALGVSLVHVPSLAPEVVFQLKGAPRSSESRVCGGVVVVASAGDEAWPWLVAGGVGAWAGHAHTFLLIMPREGEERDALDLTSSILLHPDFRFEAQVVAATRDTDGSWSVYTTTLFSGDARISLARVGTWSPSSGFWQDVRLFPEDKMADLRGYTFSVAALTYSPFIMNADLSLSGPGKYRGLEVRLLDVLAATANFTYRYVAPEDSQWGRRDHNGTWTGMIGMVIHEQADWAVSDITFSAQRELYVDFCQPFVYDASELVTPRAKPLPRWLGPVRPFTWQVWLGVGVAVGVAAPFLCAVARLSALLTNTHGATWFKKIKNAAMFVVEPVFQRGTKRGMKVVPGRVFSGFWLIFCMIIGISYSSSLTSFLITPGLQRPIQNLHQLVTSDIGWAKVFFGGIQNDLLEETHDPVLIALRQGVQWRDSLEEILHEVVKGKLATWDNSITTRLLIAIKYTDSKGQPLVHLPGFELLQERIAWPMQQYAPYKPRFDELISRVVEGGFVQEWLKSIIFEEQALRRQALRRQARGGSGEGEEEARGEKDQVVLNLEHFEGPFYVLLLGCLAGGGVLLLELLASLVKNSPA
nr:glutamate receptor ionotropic, delta-1-like isoform X1 [Procambarus clarkii]